MAWRRLSEAAGKPGKAAAVFSRDLGEWPENVWSLYGLKEARKKQNKNAALVEKQFQAAMKFADLPVKSSCMCLCNP